MKTIIMDLNKWRMCSCLGKRTSSSGCCCSMHMMNGGKEVRINIINKYKKRQQYEESSIYNSIDFRAAT